MTTTGKAARDGSTAPAQTRLAPRDGLPRLRREETKTLISLVCEAVGQADALVHGMHACIYSRDGQFRPDQLARDTDEVLACWETADHYLRLLGAVLADYDPQSESALAVLMTRLVPDGEPPY